MKLRYFAIALTVTLATAAYGQSGAYLTFDSQMFSQDGIYVNPATDAGGHHGNIDRPWLFGAGYGVYYDITHLPKLGAVKTGPVVIGVDGSGDTLRLSEYGSTLNRQDGIFSLRVAPKQLFGGTTPYVIAGFGIGHTKIPFATHYSNNFVYRFGIGADRKINPRLDWRIFQASAGFLGNYRVPGPANQSNYLITLGTGLVFRIR